MTDTRALTARRDVVGLRIGVLVSGNGTNLQAILDACARGDIPGGVVLVVSSSGKAFALERARRAGVPTVVLAPKEFSDRASYDARLIELLRSAQAELVCLAGFLRILTPQFVEQFRCLRVTGRWIMIATSLQGRDAYGLSPGVRKCSHRMARQEEIPT